MDNNTITCLVRGPASRFPSGYLWLYPAWFAILGAALLYVGRRVAGSLPLFVAVCLIGALLAAWITALCVLLTATRAAFRADAHGIILGSRGPRRPGRRTRRVALSWPDIAQVSLVPRHYGTLAEILLSPDAPPQRRPNPALQAVVLLGALIFPPVAGSLRPALTVSRRGRPRYRVKICYSSAAELRFLLTPLAPDRVPVRAFKSLRAARRLTPPPAFPAFPPWPAAPPAWPGASVPAQPAPPPAHPVPPPAQPASPPRQPVPPPRQPAPPLAQPAPAGLIPGLPGLIPGLPARAPVPPGPPVAPPAQPAVPSA